MTQRGAELFDDDVLTRSERNISSQDPIAESRFVVDRLFELWRLYITWYTFAFTANLLALSWIGLQEGLMKQFAEDSLRMPVLVFASVWILVNLLNTIGSIVIDIYTGRRVRRARRLIEAAYEGSNTPSSVRVEHNFPRGVASLAAQGNTISLFVFTLVWFYIFLKAYGFGIDAMLSGWIFGS